MIPLGDAGSWRMDRRRQQQIAPTSARSAKTSGRPARGPAFLPPHAPTQVAASLSVGCHTKVVAALAVWTQVHSGTRDSGQSDARVKVAPISDDPETLRPDEAQQAAEHIRRSAKTKLVSIIPTLMASLQPMTQPMPMPTLLDGDLPSKLILRRGRCI